MPNSPAISLKLNVTNECFKFRDTILIVLDILFNFDWTVFSMDISDPSNGRWHSEKDAGDPNNERAGMSMLEVYHSW